MWCLALASHTETIAAEQCRLHRDIKHSRDTEAEMHKKSINVSHWTPQEKTCFEAQEEVILCSTNSLHTVPVCLSMFIYFGMRVLAYSRKSRS